MDIEQMMKEMTKTAETMRDERMIVIRDDHFFMAHYEKIFSIEMVDKIYYTILQDGILPMALASRDDFGQDDYTEIFMKNTVTMIALFFQSILPDHHKDDGKLESIIDNFIDLKLMRLMSVAFLGAEGKRVDFECQLMHATYSFYLTMKERGLFDG